MHWISRWLAGIDPLDPPSFFFFYWIYLFPMIAFLRSGERHPLVPRRLRCGRLQELGRDYFYYLLPIIVVSMLPDTVIISLIAWNWPLACLILPFTSTSLSSICFSRWLPRYLTFIIGVRFELVVIDSGIRSCCQQLFLGVRFLPTGRWQDVDLQGFCLGAFSKESTTVKYHHSEAVCRGGKRQGRSSKEETEKSPMPTELCFAIKMCHHALHPYS